MEDSMRALLIIFVACLFPGFAHAADAPREIDFTQVLRGPTGETLMARGDDGKLDPVTLGDVAAVALDTDDDRNVDPKVKFERDQLARKIYKNAHAILSPEDIATIKARIGKIYGPAQIGATWPLLDPTLNK
jgi:hypothetical protein